jgi:hypothetical protein
MTNALCRGTRVRVLAALACAGAPGCYTGVASDEVAEGGSESDGDGVGEDEGSGSDDGVGACGEAPAVAYTPMRRLSRHEYENSVLDLVGVAPDTSSFPADENTQRFVSNNAAAVARLTVEEYMNAAAEVALALEPAQILPCDPDEAGHESCARAFAESFGRRAYRRPLASDEIDAIADLLLGKAALTTFADGVRLAVELMLQSPDFLYRPEHAPIAGEAAAPLSDFEVATRLSYLLWAAGPDDALLEAADAGELATADGIAAQAERMLDDPKAARGIASFHQQWLGLVDLPTLQKDTGAFPEFGPELRSAMQAETLAFVEDVVRGDGDGSFETLFTARHSWVNEPLAAIYGIDGITGPELRRVELPAGQRGGILTQPGSIAVMSAELIPMPPRVGRFVQLHLLCNQIDLPNDVDAMAPEVDPDASTREAWEQKTSPAGCVECHGMLNPIGFAFLHYDAIGRWRDMDGAFPVDASGSLDSLGQFEDAVELGALVAQSEQARTCYVRQWFRYGLGRKEDAEEHCSTGTVTETFIDADGDIRMLVESLVTSDAFRFAGASPE